MSGSWFVRLSNTFLFPGPEPSTINILYEWLEISGQLGLCSFMSSFKTSSNIVLFAFKSVLCF